MHPTVYNSHQGDGRSNPGGTLHPLGVLYFVWRIGMFRVAKKLANKRASFTRDPSYKGQECIVGY